MTDATRRERPEPIKPQYIGGTVGGAWVKEWQDYADRLEGLLGAANNALAHQASLLSAQDRELACSRKAEEMLRQSFADAERPALTASKPFAVLSGARQLQSGMTALCEAVAKTMSHLEDAVAEGEDALRTPATLEDNPYYDIRKASKVLAEALLRASAVMRKVGAEILADETAPQPVPSPEDNLPSRVVSGPAAAVSPNDAAPQEGPRPSPTPSDGESVHPAAAASPSTELERLRRFQREVEEAEARCCPEDFGFEEWIGILTKRLAQGARNEIIEEQAELPEEPTEEIIDAMMDGYVSWGEQQETGTKITQGDNMARVYRTLRNYLHRVDMKASSD